MDKVNMTQEQIAHAKLISLKMAIRFHKINRTFEGKISSTELLKTADEIYNYLISPFKKEFKFEKKTPLDNHIELLKIQIKNDRNNDDYKAFYKKLIIILEDLKQKESL